jgi:hypothetical protein
MSLKDSSKVLRQIDLEEYLDAFVSVATFPNSDSALRMALYLHERHVMKDCGWTRPKLAWASFSVVSHTQDEK